MAEFTEVMRQLGRICSTNFGECDICDLFPFCPSKTSFDKYVKSDRLERLEKMVLTWAAEHPKLVYPTWGEYLCDIGLIGDCTEAEDAISRLFNNTINPDIAQKLGIEPKEV